MSTMITLPGPNEKPPLNETAPSAVVKEGPALARFIGFAGLFLLILGVVVVAATNAVGPRLVRESWGFMAGALGILLLLYHAMSDGEFEIRRMYGGGAAFMLFLAVVLSIVPGPYKGGDAQHVGYYLLPWGVGAGLVGLLFTVAFCRHETEELYLNIASYVLLTFGALLTVGNVTAGIFKPDFLAGPGIALGLLGVGFLGGYFAKEDTSSGIGYTVAFTLGVVGAAVVLYALGRAIFPTVLADGPNILRRPNQSLDSFRVLGRVISIALFLGVILWGLVGKKPIWLRATLALIGLVGAGVFITASFSSPVNVTPKPSLVPGGVCLIGLGVVYLAISLGVCSDNQFVTLTRRELSAYFFSPIGFLVLGGMALAQWISYVVFIGILTSAPTMPEPIVQAYGHGILNFFVFALLIPVLTMRLFAEEKRTGSLEVLLTSPVNETVVVLSKFVGTLIFYMICWLPSGLFLISLRVVGDQPFDYRPLFGYYVGLLGLGAMFISMGMFFSSLTRNQIISAMLTFLVMYVLLFFAILRFNPTILPLPDSFLAVAERLSYYHMWEESLSGQLPIRDVLLTCTLAVFGLYITVKVLESRKWS